MVKKCITLLILTALAFTWYSWPTEKKQIIHQFSLLEKYVSKAEAETALALTRRVYEIRQLISVSASFEIEKVLKKEDVSPEEVSNMIVASWKLFPKTTLSFHDLRIEGLGEGQATVYGTAFFVIQNREGVLENHVRELEFELVKEDGKWLFHSCKDIVVID